jgi:hypothetical protein
MMRNFSIRELQPQRPWLDQQLHELVRAAEAIRDYPGAYVVAKGILKRLRRMQASAPKRFKDAVLRKIAAAEELIPSRCPSLVDCPQCCGSGTIGWLLAHRRVCGLCGGWKRVEKT